MRFRAILWAALLASPALAPTSRGTVTGTAMDSSRAVVPEAKVELMHTGTGVVRSTVINEAGLYRFDAVDLGKYDLRVAKAGFKTFVGKRNNSKGEQ